MKHKQQHRPPVKHWPQGLKDLAIQMWSEGHSASIIAHRAGPQFDRPLTRNAVIGFLNRGGYTKEAREGAAQIRKPREVKVKIEAPVKLIAAKPEKPAPVPYKKISEAIDAAEIVVERGVSLLALHDAHCRYPITDDAPYLFCGRRRAPGCSYCEMHLRKTMTPRKHSHGPQALSRPHGSA